MRPRPSVFTSRVTCALACWAALGPSTKCHVLSSELADTINAMIDTLATFADQVSTVAREVGIEGNLGGQARVPGAAGKLRTS